MAENDDQRWTVQIRTPKGTVTMQPMKPEHLDTAHAVTTESFLVGEPLSKLVQRQKTDGMAYFDRRREFIVQTDNSFVVFDEGGWMVAAFAANSYDLEDRMPPPDPNELLPSYANRPDAPVDTFRAMRKMFRSFYNTAQLPEWDKSKVLHILTVSVLPEWRGFGIQTLGVKMMLAKAKSRGFTHGLSETTGAWSRATMEKFGAYTAGGIEYKKWRDEDGVAWFESIEEPHQGLFVMVTDLHEQEFDV